MKHLIFLMLIWLTSINSLFAQQKYFEKGDYLLSLGAGYRNEYHKLDIPGSSSPNFRPVRLPPIYLKGSYFFASSMSVSLTAQWRLYQYGGSAINNQVRHYFHHTTNEFGMQVLLDFYWLRRKSIMIYTSMGVDYMVLFGKTKYSSNNPPNNTSIGPVQAQGGNDFSNTSPFKGFGGTLFGIKYKLSKKLGLELEGPQTGVAYARMGLTWKLNSDKEYTPPTLLANRFSVHLKPVGSC